MRVTADAAMAFDARPRIGRRRLRRRPGRSCRVRWEIVGSGGDCDRRDRLFGARSHRRGDGAGVLVVLAVLDRVAARDGVGEVAPQRLGPGERSLRVRFERLCEDGVAPALAPCQQRLAGGCGMAGGQLAQVGSAVTGLLSRRVDKAEGGEVARHAQMACLVSPSWSRSAVTCGTACWVSSARATTWPASATIRIVGR